MSNIKHRHIATLKNLTTLNLAGCLKFQDGRLQHLTGLPKLTKLDLRSYKQITGAGLEHLAKLPYLTKLRLQRCEQITEADLECYLTYSRGKHQLQKMKSIFDKCNLLCAVLDDLIADYWLPPTPTAIIKPNCKIGGDPISDKDYVVLI